jgi:hypothetical protein
MFKYEMLFVAAKSKTTLLSLQKFLNRMSKSLLEYYSFFNLQNI